MNSEFSRFTEVVGILNARLCTTIDQGRAAAQLGVSREHLNRVLNGKRESRSLIIRHQKLFGGAR